MAITTNGLVLYLPLYSTDLQGSPITSKDASLTSCTVTGATWGVRGRTFNGTSHYISCGSSSAFQVTVGTLGMWFKPADITLNGYILSMPYTTNWSGEPYYSFGIYQSTNRIQLQVSPGGTRASLQSDANELVNNTWFHIWVTWDGTTGRIYKNATDVKNSNLLGSGNLLYSGLPKFSIATRNVDALGEYGKGDIGEVWYYNRVLSATEISDNFNETVKTYKACWNFATWK